MIFSDTEIEGVFIVEPERIEDERGFFARSWCHKEFEAKSLNSSLVQCSISFNTRKGTLRGMHYQAEPFAEAKLIRCTAGAVYDVVVDLRPASPTYTRWVAVELNRESEHMLYVPEGLAHGFLTLEDNTELFYQISEYYHPEASRGVRWNDPAFCIRWPAAPVVVSRKDQEYGDFRS